MDDHPNLLSCLEEFFGFSSLRPGQDEVVEQIMAGRDVLAIMPTGGGKSLCYQLPALCREGLVVVVSPLIALMKDQVDALVARGIAAAAIHSGLGSDEYRQVMGDFYQNRLKLLYVAPERFAQAHFRAALAQRQISLLAIDEAHCLSQWGHDFRPDYLRLGRVREQLGFPQTAAFTATATQQVRDDILQTLQLQEPAVVISGFSRKNLAFRITHCEGRQAKFARLRALVEQHEKGIIYCSTRKNVMLVHEQLREIAPTMVAYHAGMSDEEREFSQEAFISGRANVVVATNAFGMGIDRADVRFVAHFEIPGSVEAYYQEAGRAGRDGADSVCELLFNHADLKTQEFFFEGSNPPIATVRALYNTLRALCDSETGELVQTVDELCAHVGKEGNNAMAISTALSILVHAGAIERFDVPGRLARGTRVLNPAIGAMMLPIDEVRLSEKSSRDHQKIEAITRFAYSEQCRHQWVLDYFGELGSPPCGSCDRCAAGEPDGVQELEGEQKAYLLKALSGVARASRRLADGSWEAIYGRSKIIKMLKGSKSELMHSGLTRLSTYGILSDLSEDQLRGLFNAMQQMGYLLRGGGELPLVTLSAAGDAVMRSQQPARLAMGWLEGRRERSRRARAAEAALSSALADKELLGHLRELRRDLGAEFNLPLYRIMANATLEEFARRKPLTVEAAMQIKGVGPWIRENYLQAFLDLIATYEGV